MLSNTTGFGCSLYLYSKLLRGLWMRLNAHWVCVCGSVKRYCESYKENQTQKRQRYLTLYQVCMRFISGFEPVKRIMGALESSLGLCLHVCEALQRIEQRESGRRDGAASISAFETVASWCRIMGMLEEKTNKQAKSGYALDAEALQVWLQRHL